MQTPLQLTIRSLSLTVVSVVIILGLNIIPAGDMQTFVLALDEDTENITKIEYTGVPGETVKGQIVLQNPSENTKNIIITLNDLEEEEVQLNGLATSKNLYECCKNWINLPEGESYTIEPKQKAVITYEVHIPEDAEANNYYGAFIVTEIDPVTKAPVSKTHHCNIVKLKIFHKFDDKLGMLGASGFADGASEINMYSPVFALLAALMLATGLALGAKWCVRKYIKK